MKRLVILMALILPIYCFAQADTTLLKQKDQYCMVTVQTWGSHREIIVDSGQKMNSFRDQKLKDDKGKPVKFESNIHVLNYMAQQGWELVASYGSPKESGDVVYTFKKPVNTDKK